MTTEMAPQTVALWFVRELVPDLEKRIKAASSFNDLPNIPWNLRQQVRTIEGKLDAIVIDCIDLVGRLGTEEAEAYLEEQWPDP
jgi:hypothetical protein